MVMSDTEQHIAWLNEAAAWLWPAERTLNGLDENGCNKLLAAAKYIEQLQRELLETRNELANAQIDIDVLIKDEVNEKLRKAIEDALCVPLPGSSFDLYLGYDFGSALHRMRSLLREALNC